MVTTRSRGNKQAIGLDTAPDMTTASVNVQQPTTASTSPLKRKSGTTAPTDTSPATKIAKTDLDPELEMNTEPDMPPAPAPTPVAASNTTAAKQHHNNQLPLQQQLPASASMSQPSLDDIIAAATAGSSDPIVAAGTATASSNGNGALPATAPPAPAVEASLEAMKEPEPESAPLPELSTVLTEPLTQQQPPAPTAPALSTIAAPAPVSASAATVADSGVLPHSPVVVATEDPTVHGGALPPSTHNDLSGRSNSIVHPDAFAINPNVNAVDPAFLTPMPSAPPLPSSTASGSTPADQSVNSNKTKGEAAIANNIGINTAGGGGGMAPTAPVVAPSDSGAEQKAGDQHVQQSEAGAKPTVVSVQPLSSVI
ncbi:hypothetical protein BG015_012122 [Linnemannia schmuckeri]|uniref:Uncharacterized protein n=1 Tax=Linnemannia schmuckeri TaxID=64567 RepID=A0A9P5RTR8_9FUNG|nr:hypothetical protein BG015_012122 [Linnemannia schmuckeri]